MEPILRQSKTSSHYSIGFVLAGAWAPDKTMFIDFQKSLLAGGLEFTQSLARPNGYQLRREAASSPLAVTLDSPAPQLHSLQIMANNPSCDLEMFCRDVEAVTTAYQRTWAAEQYQVLNTNAKIHHLYSSQTHAFKYLWEQRLGQSPEDFKLLGGRPVVGGGLRLLMPPQNIPGQDPVSVELRIESFLREPGKLLVETVFAWPRPRTVAAEQSFSGAVYLETVEHYAAGEVWNFITRSASADD